MRSLIVALAAAASLMAESTAELPFGRVYSALDPATTSSIAVRVEQIETSYAAAGFPRRRPDIPIRIIVFENPFELSPFLGPGFHPTRNPGLAITGPEHHDILVAWNTIGDPWRTLAHELAHLVDPSTDRPLWFREGFAEYLARLHAPPHAPEAALTQGGWIPLEQALSARRGDEVATQPGFYSECRLIVDWMARQGAPIAELRPEALERLIEERGREAVEQGVRELAESLTGEPPLPRVEPPPPAAPARPAPPWERGAALADALRTIGRIEEAERRLIELEESFPEAPTVQAALGELAFDRGRYAEAERRLKLAARDPQAEPRTFHRLALLLLRPVDEPGPDRDAEATLYARLAAEARPDNPRYRLTLAQALMASERWEESVSELARLSRITGWRARAFDEYREIERRRLQAMWRVEAPMLAARADAAPMGLFPNVAAQQLPLPPKAQPPPAVQRWPPPGVAVVAGKIQSVDCTADGKIIVLASRLFSMRFREPKGRPARLFSPPLKWDELPCGTYGWYVNLAYRPLRGSDLRGDVVAILF